MSGMPRRCKNGGTVPVHICRTKSCRPIMRGVCHTEILTLEETLNPSPNLCDTCTGEECLWIFDTVKVTKCPGYTGPLDGRGPIYVVGKFDFTKVKYRYRWRHEDISPRGAFSACGNRVS